MVTMASREAKNKFGEMLDTAQREPVTIARKGRPVAVLISQQEYMRLQDQEDALWASRADAALRQADYIGTDASLTVLKELVADAKA